MTDKELELSRGEMVLGTSLFLVAILTLVTAVGIGFAAYKAVRTHQLKPADHTVWQDVKPALR